jgi:hypothetical protein
MFIVCVPAKLTHPKSYLFFCNVSDSLTLISPLADFTVTEMPSIGLSELPFFTEPTVTNQIARLIKFGVIVQISQRKILPLAVFESRTIALPDLVLNRLRHFIFVSLYGL